MNIDYDDVKVVEGIMMTGCECYGECRNGNKQYCKLERFRNWIENKEDERSNKPEPEDIY